MKYYAITTSMIFTKTVLVPVEAVVDINEAIEAVDNAVEDCTILLLTEEAECETKPCTYADDDGTCELSDADAKHYQIIKPDREEE